MSIRFLGKHIAGLTLLTPVIAHAADQPNIIYIFTDQHTAKAMSCAGNRDVSTPNIDRLAKAGIRMTNAYCTAPLSGPSRGSMFTGHYPDAVGMAVNGAAIPDSLKGQTLGTLMTNAGYECAYGGKWHVPELAIPDKRYGFTQIYTHSDNGLGEACAEFLSRKHMHPFFLVASYDNPHNICEYARSQNLPYGNIPAPDIRDCPGLPDNYAKNPYDADVIEHERAMNYNVYPTAEFTPDDWRMYRYTYYRLVEKVDSEIGKIIDAIDKNNLWDNTVVIFSSDHGDGTGAHRWNQKSALYEEVVNIPLIVTLPGKKHAGTELPQLVSNGVDFFATVCDFGGAKMPSTAAGHSFRHVVESGSADTP
ncbi:MAG: sulfatase-like hydrolase/transferase, partial [Muribaculaceae bacterium]|nr:sulfatase-like hydrolase/transferase [Muribaculaceae bacterium]